jgi:hypothetical protein
MDVNLYFYIESLALTAPQVNTLVTQLKALGQANNHITPRFRNHWRIRPDNQAAIFEGIFDDQDLTAIRVRNRLAAIFSVSQASITYATNQTAYGPLVTFTYSSVARLRVGVFAGPTATYKESQSAVTAYLKDNSAAWNENLV